MKENWKSIKGYAGLYEVSDLGNVRSLKCGKVRVLKPSISHNGYYLVNLYKDGESKSFYVHSLVVTAFKGPIPAGMQVNHINEDKTDNRLENLEIVTAKQNCNHGTRNERMAKAKSKELKLTHAKSCAKYTFTNIREASAFFSYKNKDTVGTLISNARKRGENFINIRHKKYYFSQSL